MVGEAWIIRAAFGGRGGFLLVEHTAEERRRSSGSGVWEGFLLLEETVSALQDAGYHASVKIVHGGANGAGARFPSREEEALREILEERKDVDGWGGAGLHDFGPFIHQGVEFRKVGRGERGATDSEGCSNRCRSKLLFPSLYLSVFVWLFLRVGGGGIVRLYDAWSYPQGERGQRINQTIPRLMMILLLNRLG